MVQIRPVLFICYREVHSNSFFYIVLKIKFIEYAVIWSLPLHITLGVILAISSQMLAFNTFRIFDQFRQTRDCKKLNKKITRDQIGGLK